MAVTKNDQFFALLQKSQLLSEEKWAQAKEAAAGAEDAVAAAKLLIRKGLLSRWQASQLLAGRSTLSLGKYRLIELIGKGGMGNVFLAEHVTMNRRVALKIVSRELARDKAALERFLAEARAIAALDHPSIVQAYSVDNEGDRYYIVMEYVDGRNLQKVVDDDGPLDIERAANYVTQAADALVHAHGKGMIHCDIKPANLLVNEQGTVKILDMGLARLTGTEEKQSDSSGSRVLGSVDYLAPEQGMNASDLDGRADIYALGCTLYFLLTGRPPFPEGTLHERIVKHQTADPTPITELRSDVPENLAAVCAKMMAKKPADRYQSGGEIVEALSEWCEPQRKLKGIPLAEDTAPAFSLNVEPTTIASRAGGRSKPRKEPKPAPAPKDKTSSADEGELPNTAKPGRRRMLLLVGGGIAAVMLLMFLVAVGVVVGLVIAGGSGSPDSAEGDGQQSASGTAPAEILDDVVLDDLDAPADNPEKAASAAGEPASPPETTNGAAPADAQVAPGAVAASSPPASGAPPAGASPAPAQPTPPAATPGEAPAVAAAETPKPAEPKPAEPKPAEPKPAEPEPPKPAELPKPAQPALPKDPFEKWPAFFALPLLDPKAEASAQARGPYDMGEVHARAEAPWDVTLVGGDIAAKGSRVFAISKIAGDKPAWMVRLEPKTAGKEGDAQDVARLWVEGPMLKFQWADAAEPATANGFRNCLLKVSVDGAVKPLSLFQTQIVEPIAFDLKRGMLKTDLPLEYAPVKEALFLEITSADQAYPITVNPEGAVPVGTPLTLVFMRTALGNNVVEAVGFRGTPVLKGTSLSMSFRMQFPPGTMGLQVQMGLPQLLRQVPGTTAEEKIQGLIEQMTKQRETAEKAYADADHTKKAERGQAVEVIDQQLWYVGFFRAAESTLKLQYRLSIKYDEETTVDFARTQ